MTWWHIALAFAGGCLFGAIVMAVFSANKGDEALDIENIGNRVDEDRLCLIRIVLTMVQKIEKKQYIPKPYGTAPVVDLCEVIHIAKEMLEETHD